MHFLILKNLYYLFLILLRFKNLYTRYSIDLIQVEFLNENNFKLYSIDSKHCPDFFFFTNPYHLQVYIWDII